MTHLDVAIIGGGLFGQIIAKHLRALGRRAVVFDAKFKNAGSHPAACLMKPSWLSAVPARERTTAFELLDRHYGLQTIQFKVGPAMTGVHWVDPAVVLGAPCMEEEVVSIQHGECFTTLSAGREKHYSCEQLIVAAGIWSSRLVGVPGLKGQAGVAFTWEVPNWPHNFQPFIQPWAPFKQIVAFMRSPTELWCGDGSSIKQENWTEDHLLHSCARCKTALGTALIPRARVGIRPYVKDARIAYLEKTKDGIWVATGGAKNGTLAAAWCAQRLGEELT